MNILIRSKVKVIREKREAKRLILEHKQTKKRALDTEDVPNIKEMKMLPTSFNVA